MATSLPVPYDCTRSSSRLRCFLYAEERGPSASASIGSRSSSTSAPPLAIFDSASPEPPQAHFAHLQARCEPLPRFPFFPPLISARSGHPVSSVRHARWSSATARARVLLLLLAAPSMPSRAYVRAPVRPTAAPCRCARVCYSCCCSASCSALPLLTASAASVRPMPHLAARAFALLLLGSTATYCHCRCVFVAAATHGHGRQGPCTYVHGHV